MREMKEVEMRKGERDGDEKEAKAERRGVAYGKDGEDMKKRTPPREGG